MSQGKVMGAGQSPLTQQCKKQDGTIIIERFPKFRIDKRILNPLKAITHRLPSVEEILIEGDPNSPIVKEIREEISHINSPMDPKVWGSFAAIGGGIAALGRMPWADPVGALIVGGTIALAPGTIDTYLNYQNHRFLVVELLRANATHEALKRSLLHTPPSIEIGKYRFYPTPTEYESTCQYTVKRGRKVEGRIPYLSRMDPLTGKKELVFLLFHPFSGRTSWLEVLPEFFKALEAQGYLLSMADPMKSNYIGGVLWPTSEEVERIYSRYIDPLFRGEWSIVRSYHVKKMPLGWWGNEYLQLKGAIPTEIVEEVSRKVVKEALGKEKKRLIQEVAYLSRGFAYLPVKSRQAEVQ